MHIQELQDADRNPWWIGDIRPWDALVSKMLASRQREIDDFWPFHISTGLMWVSLGANFGTNLAAVVVWAISFGISAPWSAVRIYRHWSRLAK